MPIAQSEKRSSLHVKRRRSTQNRSMAETTQPKMKVRRLSRWKFPPTRLMLSLILRFRLRIFVAKYVPRIFWRHDVR
jgi:hypothetical protein